MTDIIHPACQPVDQLLRDCQFERTRRGGPGGQHRNKVDSAVVVTHLPTGVAGQASERRSQHANRAMAIERLRLNLAITVRTPGNRANDENPSGRQCYQPSPTWQSRVTGRRLSISISHTDYPALLAEALNVLADHQFQVTAAAQSLSVSSSQLIKFLKSTPAAFSQLNSQRQQRGLKALR